MLIREFPNGLLAGEEIAEEGTEPALNSSIIQKKLAILRERSTILRRATWDNIASVYGSFIYLGLEITRLELKLATFEGGQNEVASLQRDIQSRAEKDLTPDLQGYAKTTVGNPIVAAFKKAVADGTFGKMRQSLLLAFPNSRPLLRDEYGVAFTTVDTLTYTLLFAGGVDFDTTQIHRKYEKLKSYEPGGNEFLRFTEAMVRAQLSRVSEIQGVIFKLVELRSRIPSVGTDLHAFEEEVNALSHGSNNVMDRLELELVKDNAAELQRRSLVFVNSQIRIHESQKEQLTADVWNFLETAIRIKRDPRLELLLCYRDLLELNAFDFAAHLETAILAIKDSAQPDEYKSSLKVLTADAREQLAQIETIQTLLVQFAQSKASLRRSIARSIDALLSAQHVPDNQMTLIIANSFDLLSSKAGETSVQTDLQTLIGSIYGDFVHALEKVNLSPPELM